MSVARLVLSTVLLLGAVAAHAQQPPAGEAPQQPQMTEEQFAQMVSYALGRSIADDCRMGGVRLDTRAMMTGINEVGAGKDPQWQEEQLNQVMQAFAVRIQQHIADENKQRGEAFRAANAKKPGVQVTPSGLQYKVLQEGDGATPTDNSMVVCHYTGSFVDGQVFESSRDAGQPAQFPVTRVIPGWTEALKMMKVGDKYQLVIPPELAYGPQGDRGIGPNETLVFEIELLQVGQLPQQQPGQ